MKIIITGVPPYDGAYPLDMARLTNRDIHTIKTIAGYTPLEYEAAGERGDNDFVVAIAVIAIRHSGLHHKIDEDAFWDAEAGKIQVELDEAEEEAAGPPLIAPETPTTRSGAPSPTVGDSPQEKTLRLTGTDSSATSG